MLEYVEIYSYFRNVRFDNYSLLSQKFNVNEFLNETLSTREQANLLWFLIIVILLLLWNQTRKSILEIIKAFIRILFTVWGGIVLCYLILIGSLLYYIGAGSIIIIKEFIIWTIFTLFPIMGTIIQDYRKVNLETIIKDSIKLSVIPIFVLSSYTFGFWSEFFIIPIMVMLTLFVTVCDFQKDSKYNPVKKLFSMLKSIFYIFFIINVILGILNSIKELTTMDYWFPLALEVILIICNIPLLWLLKKYMCYDKNIPLVRIKTGLGKYQVGLILFLKCGLNEQKLMRLVEIIRSSNQYKSLVDIWKIKIS